MVSPLGMSPSMRFGEPGGVSPRTVRGLTPTDSPVHSRRIVTRSVSEGERIRLVPAPLRPPATVRRSQTAERTAACFAMYPTGVPCRSKLAARRATTNRAGRIPHLHHRAKQRHRAEWSIRATAFVELAGLHALAVQRQLSGLRSFPTDRRPLKYSRRDSRSLPSLVGVPQPEASTRADASQDAVLKNKACEAPALQALRASVGFASMTARRHRSFAKGRESSFGGKTCLQRLRWFEI